MRFEDLLNRVLDKPTMYIGNYSLERMRAFISGYAVCLYDRGETFDDDPEEFTQFVRKKYGVTDYSHGWEETLQMLFCSEQDAYDNLVETFRAYQGIEGAREGK